MRGRIITIAKTKFSSTAYLHKQLTLMQTRYFSTLPLINQKVNIYHLQQMHRLPLPAEVSVREKDPEIFHAVVSSQLRVAKFLYHKKNPIVVSEGFMHDFTPEKYKAEQEQVEQVKTVFRHGIPAVYSQLTPFQQELFYHCGATTILFYLGFLENIYKSIHPKEGLMVRKALAPYLGGLKTLNDLPSTLSPFIFEIREQEALKCCKEAALLKQTPEVDVFLVFGLMHNFSKAIQFSNDKSLQYAGGYDLVTDSQDNSVVLTELKALIEAGGINELITHDKTSLQEVVQLYAEKPWLVKALAHYHINTAIKEGVLTMNQLKQLTEEQVQLLKNRFSGSALKTQVATMIDNNTQGSIYQLSKSSR